MDARSAPVLRLLLNLVLISSCCAFCITAPPALSISGIPFLGPIASAKVGYKDGNYILNPTVSQIKESDLELVVAGTKEGVLMVESEAQELSEETMLGAVMFGFENFQPVIKLIDCLLYTSPSPRD